VALPQVCCSRAILVACATESRSQTAFENLAVTQLDQPKPAFFPAHSVAIGIAYRVQGGILYQGNVPIGVVEGVASIDMYYVEIRGFANHAGTTPMKEREASGNHRKCPHAAAASAPWVIACNAHVWLRMCRRLQGKSGGTLMDDIFRDVAEIDDDQAKTFLIVLVRKSVSWCCIY
jgi:hypothetical protein